MKLSFFRKRSWKKHLAVAVTAGILAGAYAPGAMAADLAITGEYATDSKNLGTDVVTQIADNSLVYDFKDTVKLHENSLTTAVYTSKVPSNMIINGDLSIIVHGSSFSATGINAGYINPGFNTDGNLRANMVINDNVTMKDDSYTGGWGITANDIHGGSFSDTNYEGARWQPVAIKAGLAGDITINGDVDIAVMGTGLATDPYYVAKNVDDYDLAHINLNGNVNIITPKDKTEAFYSVANYGGTININTDGTNVGDKKVVLFGNVLTMAERILSSGSSGGANFYRDGRTNIALTNKDSVWTGVIDNTGARQAGEVNLWLQNSATWNHESPSLVNGINLGGLPSPSNAHYGQYDGISHVNKLVGGKSAETGGYLYQKDSADINIADYSGHTTVFYEHLNSGVNASDYTAGDITIQKAAAGSGITLVTANNNVGDEQINLVLNALAGKLTYADYSNNPDNLDATVKLAGGLTADAVTVKAGSIVFADSGKGGYESKETTFTTTLTGDAEADAEYKIAGVLQEDGSYKFAADSEIAVTGENARTISLAKGATIDASGKTLTLDIAESTKSAHGLYHNAAEAVNVKADTLNINIKSTSTGGDGAQGIRNLQGDVVLDANVNIDVNGTSNTIGIYSNNGNFDVHGNLNVKVEGNNGGYAQYGASGIYATSSMGSSKGGVLNVNGTYTFEGNANGIYANSGGSVVNVEGGSIKVAVGQKKGYAALIAEDATINMNVVNGEATNNKVNVEGNVVVSTGATNENDIHGEKTTINLGLTTADSTLHGAVYNAFPAKGVEKEGITFTGAANLWLQNGATWNNEVVDTLTSIPSGASYAGSHVTTFKGGASAAAAGNIYQKDRNALTIDNYSGVTNVFYANDGSGDFRSLGDTIIKHAEENSAINLITTAPTNVTVDSITSVLNALAGKLTYAKYATANGSERNLTGTAKLAGGLTSDSVVMALGNIVFDEGTGKGTGVSDIKATGPDHQVITEFANTLTGDVNNDLAYVLGGVRQADGSYKFTENSKIAVDGAAAIQADSDLNVDASGKALVLKANNYGIKNATTNSVNIKADSLKIEVNGSTANGINIENTASGLTKAIIDAKTDVTNEGGTSFGIKATGNTQVEFKKDVTIKSNNIGKYPSEWSSAGIYAAVNFTAPASSNRAATVSIDGRYAYEGNGVGAFVNGEGSTINLNGSVDIKANNDNLAALQAQNGTINVNMANPGKGNVVSINGNAFVDAGSANNGNKVVTSAININMDTADSVWTGVAYNQFPTEGITDATGTYKGELNLQLSNGATWNNEKAGEVVTPWSSNMLPFDNYGSHITKFTGGSTTSAGNIYQKDSNALTIDNYSGVTNVFYANNANGDFSAYGDTIIKHAEENSAINLITTAPTNVTADSITSVLSALAGKLTYVNYATANDSERNLTGTAKIAGGLTSNSAVMAFGDIVFNDVTGKGSLDLDKPIKVPEPPKVQEQTNFNSGLNGDTNLEYVVGGVLKNDGSYKFTENTKITVDGSAAISADNKIEVNAAEQTLTLNVTNSASGIAQETNNKIDVTANKVVVEAEGTSIKAVKSSYSNNDKTAVININAETEIKATGPSGATGVYAAGNAETNLNGNVKVNVVGNVSGDASFGYYSTSGLRANNDYVIQKGGTINVNGSLDITTDGTGIFANGGGSTVNVNGGVNIEATSDYMPAVVAQSGTVNINANADANNIVNIKGNIVAGAGSVFGGEPCKESVVNINMLNNASILHGVVYNQFPEEGIDAGASTYSLRVLREAASANFTGAVNLNLANGAKWINEAQGALPQAYTAGGGIAFTGSRVAQLKGGTGNSVGYIYQKDRNDLTIDELSGNINITYDHKIDEATQALKFEAGKTVIGSAEAGSKVTMATAAKGIDTADKAAVEAAFAGLAQKLIYNDAATKPANLTADMTIVGGLNSNTAIWKGNIEFTGINGGYQAGSAEQAINLLFDEDVVSKDTRAAIMSSMVGWRNAAADTYSYRHSARAPQGGGHGPVDSGTRLGANDEGVWARTWGGQNKYSGNNTSFKTSFWAGQVGYDKNLANGWNVGVAFDYMTSDESYNSGSGDSKTYTLGFYGSKEVAKNEFVDVTAKLGRFANDFETKDILGRTVKGDYKATGFSVSGQYSKRFGNEAAGYFEPSAQLTIGRLGSSDFDSTGTLAGHISQDAFTSIVGTLGLEAGQASEHGRYFARLSLNHEFAGSMDTHFSDAYGSMTREFDLDGTWCDLTMGGTYELGDNLTFYGDVTKTLSGDYKHDWMINAGLRFTF